MNPARPSSSASGAAPAAGRSRHWSAIGEVTCVWGVWCLYFLNRVFGRTLFRLVVYPVVTYYWLTHPLARRSSLDFLGRVQRTAGTIGRMPTWRHSLRHLFSFADTLLDKLLAIGGRYRFGTVRREGNEVLLEQIARGQGGVIMTAHMGCLELCRVLANQRQGLRLTVLVHTHHAERFNRILSRLDPQSGVQLYQVDDISPATALELTARVAAGEFVAIAGDRAPAHGGRAVRVPFMGSPARFPVGPYVLASLMRCPLYAMGCVRLREGHLLRFTELAHEVVLPRASREAALVSLATAYAAWLQALVVESPYDWFNFYEFWADDPASAGRQGAAQP
ncbi:LpxL/LpxP family acyltransferase [Cupriavidus agavae]|uniref:Putative LPLAT superfamily acyltransferase n=1 Tax=Cupriavidus agavae TaxID=1001822 RepID=A0A4Q7S351_9BURK|nr:acyltransferase [Cupriavidus agavae]RZT39292.1 putative LPLAT superfamily acyltransferase [Cupriavidus agavae]